MVLYYIILYIFYYTVGYVYIYRIYHMCIYDVSYIKYPFIALKMRIFRGYVKLTDPLQQHSDWILHLGWYEKRNDEASDLEAAHWTHQSMFRATLNQVFHDLHVLSCLQMFTVYTSKRGEESFIVTKFCTHPPWFNGGSCSIFDFHPCGF